MILPDTDGIEAVILGAIEKVGGQASLRQLQAAVEAWRPEIGFGDARFGWALKKLETSGEVKRVVVPTRRSLGCPSGKLMLYERGQGGGRRMRVGSAATGAVPVTVKS